MVARRLPAPLHPGAVRGRPVTIHVDGSAVPAFEGEPIAVSLLAAGRPVLSRSFRLHRPRGLLCSTGQCGWCECRIDGRPSVRSCRAPAAEGTVVESEHALPTVGRDVLGVLDLGARFVPPTFYHHRFLRPKRLRKRYLDVIRWFGGRGRLTIPPSVGAPTTTTRVVRSVEADVAVVGGGPAGLLAARAATAAGARVVVLDAEPQVGGSWCWRDEDVPGVGPLRTLVAALEAHPRVTIATSTAAVSIDDAGLHAIGPDALLEIDARAVVVATGSYERLPLVPGNDRPGVMGARTVEWLVRAYGVVAGDRAVLVGSGLDVERAAEALGAAGSTVVARVETADLVAVVGRGRVTGVRIRSSAGAATQVDADLVVIGDRGPATELVTAAAGIVLLAGAAAGRAIHDATDAEAATSVGREAAAGTAPTADPHRAPTREPSPSVASTRAMLCFCEDVRVADLEYERAAGYAHPELLKRRTGALTGPCQGKYCAPAVGALVTDRAAGGSPTPTTSRPPARPVRLGDLLAAPPDRDDGQVNPG